MIDSQNDDWTDEEKCLVACSQSKLMKGDKVQEKTDKDHKELT